MANSLNCPTCGASLSSDETKCRYCGSRLATVACPSCFGMMFAGSKFCPHCGGAAEKAKRADVPALTCPDCKVAMKQIQLGQTVLHQCDRCEGLWIDTESFRRICAERERQADVLGAAKEAAPSAAEAAKKRTFRYRSCPGCNRLMNRYNFANASRIVVDVCKGHGVWFDRDELRQIIEFLRAGGLQMAGQDKAERRTAHQRWLESRGASADDEADGVRYSVGAANSLLGFLGSF